jgi:GT2 family glycosyltransferase
MNTKDNYIADIIIISYKNPDMTINCVNSIFENNINKYNIIIVDNASPDDTVSVLKSALSDVKIICNDRNLGYAGAINIGAEYCSSEFLIVSNNDVIYRPGVLDTLIRNLQENHSIAVIGPAQEYPDGKRQISYGNYPGYKLIFNRFLLLDTFNRWFNKLLKLLKIKSEDIVNVDYVDGAVMVIRKDVFDKLNGFDEDFFFYSEESDFCYRAKSLGYRVAGNRDVIVTHYRGGADSFGNLKIENINKLIASKIKFAAKHYSKGKTKIYVMLEKIHYLLYSKIMALMSFITLGEVKKKFKEKASVLENFYLAWKKAENNHE